MQQAGFLEIFIDNQAQTPVYYDNLMVTQSVSPVKEVNAYYPYGMTIPGLSTPSLPEEYNAYKYNGKELQDMENFKTGWLDYGARMLDGPRWTVPDPRQELLSHQSVCVCG